MSAWTLSHTWVIKDVKKKETQYTQIDQHIWAEVKQDDNIIICKLEWSSRGFTSKEVLECNLSILKSKSDTKVLLTKKVTEKTRCENGYKYYLQAKFGDLDKYLINNELTIHIHALFCTEDFHEVIIAPPQCNNLHEGIQSLREDETFVDMSISCEGETFKVHKAVLAAQSPILKKMFQVDMKEKQTSVVEMKDVSPAVVSDLLTYLYTGEVPNIKTLAKELTTVAHKYEIPKLLLMCQKQLIVNLDISNVVELYLLSKLHDASYLKEACARLLSAKLTDLTTTPGWDDLTYENENMLLHDILSCFVQE